MNVSKQFKADSWSCAEVPKEIMKKAEIHINLGRDANSYPSNPTPDTKGYMPRALYNWFTGKDGNSAFSWEIPKKE